MVPEERPRIPVRVFGSSPPRGGWDKAAPLVGSSSRGLTSSKLRLKWDLPVFAPRVTTAEGSKRWRGNEQWHLAADLKDGL